MNDADRAALRRLGIDAPEGTKVLGIRLPEDDPPEGERLPRYEVEVPAWRPYTLNQLMRGKIKTRIALAELSDHVIARACREAGVAPALVKRRVSLVVGLGPSRKAFDVDAPWKGLLDSLVKAGALRDDSHRWCELGGLRFYRRQDHNHTTIILEDAE